MLDKLLIANRGEIAVRIIRTASRLGVDTVLAASRADRYSHAATLAGAVQVIGPAPARESYLRGDRIIAAALATGCTAIHPGYGFLAENADFAAAVTAAGLIFVGPPAEAMRALGSKAAAKHLAVRCGVPVVPGYQGEAQDVATLIAAARGIGFPVLLKAVDGGGGRGMRRVDDADQLPAALDSARREAMATFGSDRMLVEKLVERPRHIEVQVFGDSHGNVVHLFERDCSLQRRNQKVIEEAPAPGLPATLRASMTAAAVRLARAAGYRNAGTVEFLIETDGGAMSPAVLPADSPFYFIEMNTRLQVEHPVTEAVTGLDLVEWQLRVASGEPLPLGQNDVALSGHAVEARLNAEDPARDFLPGLGRIAALSIAGDIRCDTGVVAGSNVTPHYDSLLAKIIGHAPTRGEAIAKVSSALHASIVAGPATNLAFLGALLDDDDVVAGRLDTGLVGRKLDGLTRLKTEPRVRDLAVAAGAWWLLDRNAGSVTTGGTSAPWDARDGFQLGGSRRLHVTVLVDGQPTQVEASWDERGLAVAYGSRIADRATAEALGPRLVAGDEGVHVVHQLTQTVVSWPRYATRSICADGNQTAADADAVRSPINGRLVQLLVAPGDAVVRGGRIAVVEAMKMEHVVSAPRDGIVASVETDAGAQVAQGALLAKLVPSDTALSSGEVG